MSELIFILIIVIITGVIVFFKEDKNIGLTIWYAIIFGMVAINIMVLVGRIYTPKTEEIIVDREEMYRIVRKNTMEDTYVMTSENGETLIRTKSLQKHYFIKEIRYADIDRAYLVTVLKKHNDNEFPNNILINKPDEWFYVIEQPYDGFE